jgi:hypothetical protein
MKRRNPEARNRTQQDWRWRKARGELLAAVATSLPVRRMLAGDGWLVPCGDQCALLQPGPCRARRCCKRAAGEAITAALENMAAGR